MVKPNYIIGISSYYHDSAAVLLKDGEILSAVQEERFTRIKHDSAFPIQSIKFCLQENNLTLNQIDAIVFYDKPWLKLERIIETYYQTVPKSYKAFLRGIPVWLKQKMLLPRVIREELLKHFKKDELESLAIKFSNHHLSHAASAFFPSPFNDAVILTMDGVGEWTTTSISHGHENKITNLKELHFPDSVGLLYSAFTQFCGFKVNSGEYKLMGLAPYGQENKRQKKYKELIVTKLCKIFSDGSLKLDQDYFSFTYGDQMINPKKWSELFELAPRESKDPLSQEYCDMALAIQEVLEDIVMLMAIHAKEISKCENLCLAGGVALNCVVNSRLMKSGLFKSIWIQPAAGDAGGALGAALAYYYSLGHKRRTNDNNDHMKGAYLGPKIESKNIEQYFQKENINFKKVATEEELCKETAMLLDQGAVIGWFQGRMEFGPRALGGRSILADSRKMAMQKNLNLKIKNRESFRPFAPSVLVEDLKELFQYSWISPYMLLIDFIAEDKRLKYPANFSELDLKEKLETERSIVPAVTHLDFSARIQSVDGIYNPRYQKLLQEFKKNSGMGILINTSFNVRGEPIVNSVEDAVSCFLQTEMDYLVIEQFIASKADQDPIIVKDYFKRKKNFAED